MMNMNEIMLEQFKTSLAGLEADYKADPVSIASCKKLIAKYEKRIAAAKQ